MLTTLPNSQFFYICGVILYLVTLNTYLFGYVSINIIWSNNFFKFLTFFLVQNVANHPYIYISDGHLSFLLIGYPYPISTRKNKILSYLKSISKKKILSSILSYPYHLVYFLGLYNVLQINLYIWYMSKLKCKTEINECIL